MRTQKIFKKTLVYLAVCAASQGVLAADEVADVVLEEVVVSGVRGSLSKSLELKQQATSIVDSINAEELGRFPDNNVADSLSHISGVTVSRTRNGEAQYVNIRGLGPEFSIVTLNDRILATDDGGRNFAFDVIPSEMIGGADVWKTVEANHQEGSIGGAVNLRSVRPLSQPELTGVFSAQGDYNDFSEEVLQKYNAIFSTANQEETLGFIVSASHSSGDERSDDMFDNYYTGVMDGASYDVNQDDTISSDEENLVMPGSYALGSYLSDFERTGVTSALQWRPSDRIEIIADVLVTKLKANSTGFAESFYVEANPGRWTNVVMDGNVITEMDVSDVAMEVITLDEHRTVDTSLFGLNGKFDVTDTFAVEADVYRSESERNSGGKNTFVVAGAPGEHSGHFKLNEGGLPDYIPTWTEGRSSADFGNEDFAPHWAARDGSDIKDTITGLKLDGEWDTDFGVSAIASVEFGIALTRREKSNLAVDNYIVGADNYGGYPFTFADVGADVVREMPVDNFFDGEGGNFPREFPVFSIPDYAAALAASDGKTLVGPDGTERTFGENESQLWEPVPNPVNSYNVTEDTEAAYFQVNFDEERWFGNIGGRLIQTDVEAQYAYNQIISIEVINPDASNPQWDVEYSDSAEQQGEGSYTEFLPSANFGLYLTDELLLRAAAAKSLSRPTIDQLAPLTTDNALSGLFTMDISGNPNIEPVYADQADVSLEWYFEEGSALTGAVFWKELTGFITLDTRREEIAGEMFTITQPINGDTAKVLGFEVSAQKFFDNGFGLTASYSYTDTEATVGGVDAGALPGVADTAYAVSAIYEQGKISSQLSLDYTGDYVIDTYSPLGEGYHTYTEEVFMMTASLRYDLLENTQIFFEGLNLLDESNRSFQGRSDLPSSIQIYGRTFNVGVRLTF